ncbi:restriction endonuclease subunit S [Streptomyces sioyaensis]|uniref:restriction endonuclease subunit S n=1 Tax=Streptomyces sioyaensis TaxID=67364 RepID=UPI0036635C01
MNWPTVELRRLVTCLDGRRVPLNSGERAEMKGNIPYWGAGGVLDFLNQSIFDEPLVLLKEDGSPFFIPEKGVAYYVEGPTWVNNHIHALRSVNADGRFLAYALNCVDYSKYLTGSTRDKLTQEDLKRIVVCNPPLEEQRRIADYLDAETGKMDAMLRARSRMYELLDERIEHQILAVIGRSRLGDRIAGDPVLAMRWLLNKRMRPTSDSSEVITAFRDGQVTARSLRRAEGYTNSVSSAPQGQAVRIDDVVVHGLDGFAGAIGTSEAEGNCSPVYHVLTPKWEGDALYYGRMLRTLALQEYLTGFSFSTRERAFDFRNWDMFGRIPIPVASFSEQRHIGEQIRTVRPLRDKFEKFGKLLTERRQYLITAAVTGQFDVSTAGRSVTDGVSIS